MNAEIKEDSYKKALNSAAASLARRAMSVKALEEKLLSKGYSQDAASFAVARLQYLGLLDDLTFARDTMRRLSARGYGAVRIRQELLKRGAGRETVDEVMEEYEPEIEKLVEFLDKKLKGDVSDRREVEKAGAALQRRGFRWEQVSAALRAYREQLEEMDAD